MAEQQKAVHEVPEHKLFKYVTFFSRHKWRIAAVVLFALAVAVVIGLLQFSRGKSEEKAFEAYFGARTAEAYRRVEEQFPGTFYGSISLIEAGNLLYEKGDFEGARKAYQRFLDGYEESPLRAWAYNLVGNSYMAEGKYDKAVEYYRRAEASPWLKFQAKFHLGRCYELKGDSESDLRVALEQYGVARTYYRQLTESAEPSPGTAPRQTPWQRPAQERMTFLAEKERTAREKPSEKRVDKGKP